MSPRDQAAVDAAREAHTAYLQVAHQRSGADDELCDAVDNAADTLERYAAAGRPTSRVRCALELLTGVLRDATERTP